MQQREKKSLFWTREFSVAFLVKVEMRNHPGRHHWRGRLEDTQRKCGYPLVQSLVGKDPRKLLAKEDRSP
jgi:hypothetical protein